MAFSNRTDYEKGDPILLCEDHPYAGETGAVIGYSKLARHDENIYWLAVTLYGIGYTFVKEPHQVIKLKPPDRHGPSECEEKKA